MEVLVSKMTEWNTHYWAWHSFGIQYGWTLLDFDEDKTARFEVGPAKEKIRITKSMRTAMTEFHAAQEKEHRDRLDIATNGYGSGMVE